MQNKQIINWPLIQKGLRDIYDIFDYKDWLYYAYDYAIEKFFTPNKEKPLYYTILEKEEVEELYNIQNELSEKINKQNEKKEKEIKEKEKEIKNNIEKEKNLNDFLSQFNWVKKARIESVLKKEMFIDWVLINRFLLIEKLYNNNYINKKDNIILITWKTHTWDDIFKCYDFKKVITKTWLEYFNFLSR